MRQYNLFRPLYMSFYSKALYRDVGQNWQGSGLLYLLLLVVICCLPFTYYVQQNIKAGLVSIKPLIMQIPIITIKEGIVSIDKTEPYFIRDPETKRIRAIIDTTGTISSIENTDAYLLLTKNKVVLKEGVGEKSYTLSNKQNRVYTAEIVDNFIQKFAYVIVLLLYPVFIILFFLKGVVEILFYSLLAKLFIYTHLTYKTLFRLTAVAVTPMFILAAVLTSLNVNLPYRWLIYIIIAVGYLIFAIKANWEVERG